MDTTMSPSWDTFDPALLDQTDDFVLEKKQEYWWSKWGTGQLELVDQNGRVIMRKVEGASFAETLKGFYIPYDGAPAKLVEVFDKLVEKGLARKNRIKHSRGEIKEYITFKDTCRVFPLITGVKDLQSLVPVQCYRPFVIDRAGNKVEGPLPDEALNVGIATGRRIKLPKPKEFNATEKIGNFNFVAVLFVVDVLWDNGYIDAAGLPIPIRLDLDYPAGQEMYERVLVRQAQLVERARNLFPDQYKGLRPWMLGMYLQPDDELEDRGSRPGETKKVYKVTAQVPELAGKDYYQKMHVGNVGGKYQKERVEALMRLIYEQHTVNGVQRLLPTGPAMQWAYTFTVDNIKRMRKVNPASDKFPFGPQKPGKQLPCQHIIEYMTQQERKSDANDEDMPVDVSTDDPILTRLNQYKADFTRLKRLDAVDLINDTVARYNDGKLSNTQTNDFLKALETQKQADEEALDASDIPDNPF